MKKVNSYKREYEQLRDRVEQLGALIHKDGGSCVINGMSYQDFIGILLNSGYTVVVKTAGEHEYQIEYWRELD